MSLSSFPRAAASRVLWSSLPYALCSKLQTGLVCASQLTGKLPSLTLASCETRSEALFACCWVRRSMQATKLGPTCPVLSQGWTAGSSRTALQLGRAFSSEAAVAASSLAIRHKPANMPVAAEAVEAAEQHAAQAPARSRDNLHLPGAPSTANGPEGGSLQRHFLTRRPSGPHQRQRLVVRRQRVVQPARRQKLVALDPHRQLLSHQEGAAAKSRRGGELKSSRELSAAELRQRRAGKVFRDALETSKRRLSAAASGSASSSEEILENLGYRLREERHDLDWSGETSLDDLPVWSAELARHCPNTVTIKRNDAPLTVQTLWIAVHQEAEFGTARFYDCGHPIDPEILEGMPALPDPLWETEDLNFRRYSDLSSGGWHNFFIGTWGHIGPAEEDVLWPNQVIHGDRTYHNVIGRENIELFLADPTEEGVREHLANCKRLQEEWKRKPGWAYELLQKRWGVEPLQEMGILAG